MTRDIEFVNLSDPDTSRDCIEDGKFVCLFLHATYEVLEFRLSSISISFTEHLNQRINYNTSLMYHECLFLRH